MERQVTLAELYRLDRDPDEFLALYERWEGQQVRRFVGYDAPQTEPAPASPADEALAVPHNAGQGEIPRLDARAAQH